jgi:hypothetical protein
MIMQIAPGTAWMKFKSKIAVVIAPLMYPA